MAPATGRPPSSVIVPPTVVPAGSFRMCRSGTGLSPGQNSIAGTSEVDDKFGFALAAGDFDGDGRADLAIGSPGEALGLSNELTDSGAVDNDATLTRYAEMAIAQAEAGAHLLGLSGMMDGQVGYVRAALDAAGHPGTVILAYDSQPRPVKEKVVQLSPEERYTLVHGQTFAAAGLRASLAA